MKVFKIRFSSYGKSATDVEPKEVMLPEDCLFYTAGENDIGGGLSKGCLHYMAITKATDECLDKIDHLRINVVNIMDGSHYRFRTLRFNGYAIIELNDCIIEDIELIDEDTLNEYLQPKLQYFVTLGEECNIITVCRLNRIHSSSRVDIAEAYLHAYIGSYREFYTITPKRKMRLYDITHCHDSQYLVHIPDPEYGAKLLNELIYINLSIIDDKFRDNLIGYDLNYFHSKMHLTDTGYNEMYYFRGTDEEWNEFKEIRDFKKELPILKK